MSRPLPARASAIWVKLPASPHKAVLTLQAASVLGVDVVIGERVAHSPAARMTETSVVFANGWDDPAALEMTEKRSKKASRFVGWPGKQDRSA